MGLKDADFVAEKLTVEVPLKLNTKLNTKRLSGFPMEFQRKKTWKHRPQSSGTVGACVGASALPAPDRAHRAAGLEVHLVLDNYATHLGMVFGRLPPPNSIPMHDCLDVGNKMTDNGRNGSRLLIPVHGVTLEDMHISL